MGTPYLMYFKDSWRIRRHFARKHWLICEQATCSGLMLANTHVFAYQKINVNSISLVHAKIHELYSLVYQFGTACARARSMDECKPVPGDRLLSWEANTINHRTLIVRFES
jgi:hypothetical protein